MDMTRAAYIASPLPIERELRSLLSPEAVRTVFDIGACEGEDSVRYARLFPNATVYAVEPLPRNLPLLQRNAALAGPGRVRILPVALSDRVGTATFYVSSGRPEGQPEDGDWDFGNKSSSLLPPDRHLEIHPWVHFDETLEVTTETLATVCEEGAVEEIDLIHLDVQGAELAVLAGAGSILERTKVVWLEVEAVPLYQGQPLRSDVQRFMATHGFVRLLDTVGEVSGDQLYAHRGSVRIPLGLRLRGSGLARSLQRARRRVGRARNRGIAAARRLIRR